MRVCSWNVNGLRAAWGKGFPAWLADSGAAIVGLQEVRAPHAALPELPAGWHGHFVAAEKAGYSGVGLLSRQPADEHHPGLALDDFDREGRLQIARFGRLWIANGYFPNGNGKPLADGKPSNDRVPYKLGFYRALFDRLEPLRAAGDRVLVMGDFNTAHRPIDLARPKQNEGTSGFLPEERDEFSRWLDGGWIDTLRACHGDQPARYSWWSQRFGVRQKNIGWRIDYVLASGGARPFVRDAFIDAHVLGSDHCPVGVVLDPAVLG